MFNSFCHRSSPKWRCWISKILQNLKLCIPSLTSTRDAVPKRTVLTAILLTSNGKAREYVGIGAFPEALDWQTKNATRYKNLNHCLATDTIIRPSRKLDCYTKGTLESPEPRNFCSTKPIFLSFHVEIPGSAKFRMSSSPERIETRHVSESCVRFHVFVSSWMYTFIYCKVCTYQTSYTFSCTTCTRIPL